MMTNRRMSMAIVATNLGLLVACGGSGTEASDGGAGTATEITMRDNAFAPAAPVVAQGSVQLVNEGASPHTFTIEGEDLDVQVDAGEAGSASIDLEPGTYTMFCRFHRAQGMEGTLTVEA